MSSSKSLLSATGMVLGGIGIAVCCASIIILWVASTRLARATDSLFVKLDRSLVAVRERVVQTEDRVQAAKITTEDVEKSLREWTRREAGQRVAARLDAGEKTERLLATLQQADHWLDVSESSLGLIQEMLAIAGSIYAQDATALVGRLMEEIVSLRGQLAEVLETVTSLHERVTQASDEGSFGERGEQLLQLTLRIVATLGSIDSRLAKTEERVAVAQSRLQELKAGMQWWIRTITVGTSLLILLMAAGQIALCRLAWSGIRSTNVRM